MGDYTGPGYRGLERKMAGLEPGVLSVGRITSWPQPHQESGGMSANSTGIIPEPKSRNDQAVTILSTLGSTHELSMGEDAIVKLSCLLMQPTSGSPSR